MAHSNWVNSSSRQVYTKIKCRPYFDYDRGTYIVDGKYNKSVDNECYIIDQTGARTNYKITIYGAKDIKQSPTSRYLQISGDKANNDYPRDLTITDLTTENVYTITGNTKCDLIIDFGKEINLTYGFEIKITRWSRPNGTLTINKVSYNLDYEIQDMVRQYDFDNGIPYDGKSPFSYGVKSNTGSMTVLKDNINYGTLTSTTQDSPKLLSRYEAMLNNNYANILISVKTDGEFSYSQICNMFVYNIDDDKNNISATINIADVFYIMNMLKYTDAYKYEDNAKISSYAYQAIRKFESVFGSKILSIEPDYVNYDSYVTIKINFNGEKFFTVMDYISKATNTFIIQNMTKDTVEFQFLKKENLTPIEIKYNDCFSVKDERHINNNITQVKASPCTITSGANTIVSEDSSFTECKYINYLDKDFNPTGNNIIVNTTRGDVNPFIQMDNITKSGSFSVLKTEFAKYKSFGIVLECVTAYRKTYVPNAIPKTATVTGEVNTNTVYNSRLKNTRIPQDRVYIKNTDMETTTNLAEIDAKSLTTLTPEFNINVTELNEQTLQINYTLTYNYVKHFKSILTSNQYYETTLKDSGIITTGWNYEQYYLGAYKVALVGNSYDYSTTDTIIGTNDNNSNTIDVNLLIQQGNKVGGAITGQDQATVLCQDIYNEFKNGKKVATVEYVGSPYILPYKVVKLGNGTIYRVANVRTSSTGGFRQKLTLIEKE